MAGYRILPEIYDAWQKSYGKDYSTLILPRLLDTLRGYAIEGSSMLDLACGTGTLALLMSARGWSVWGVDASPGMVARANRKAIRRHLGIRFFLQDMRALEAPAPVDLITCLFDSVNHLRTRSDLAKMFRAVHGSLRRGGHFVFDVNNERCFATLWTRSDTIRRPEFTLRLKNSYEPRLRSARSDVTLVVRSKAGTCRKSEVVRERLFTDLEIASGLTGAGFEIRSSEDFNFTKEPEIGKIKTWWVAKKK